MTSLVRSALKVQMEAPFSFRLFALGRLRRSEQSLSNARAHDYDKDQVFQRRFFYRPDTRDRFGGKVKEKKAELTGWLGMKYRFPSPVDIKLLICSTLFLSLLIFASGCAVGPNYVRPEATEIPANYQVIPSEWKVATPSANLPKGKWWRIFGDSVLNNLEEEALAANQNLKASAARYEQARAQANVALSGLFPKIVVGASDTRQHDSQNRPNSSTGKPFGSSYTYNNFAVPFNLNWELDLWGRVRSQIEAARASVEASADELESVRLEITSEIAADYFTLRALDADKQLLDSTIQVYRRALELVRNRRAGGLASDLDVAQAETVLRTAEAQIPADELQRQKFQDALAVLTGKNASLFHLTEEPLHTEPPVIPPGLPSDLLERRPDIAAAERRMASANANIGVATAAFFPTVSLGGMAGLQSTNSATLFSAPSGLWAVGASLFQPLFEGGKLNAELNLAKGRYAETVAGYRETVLMAFAEVEDNLAAQRFLDKEYHASKYALESASKQLEIARNKYYYGLVTYINVSSAEATALELQRVVNRLRGERFIAAVALIKSLGGSWQISDSVELR